MNLVNKKVGFEDREYEFYVNLLLDFLFTVLLCLGTALLKVHRLIRNVLSMASRCRYIWVQTKHNVNRLNMNESRNDPESNS